MEANEILQRSLSLDLYPTTERSAKTVVQRWSVPNRKGGTSGIEKVEMVLQDE